MDITNFIPSQRQAMLKRFQQVEVLGLGAIRIELKVANPVGIIYECYIMAGIIIFLIKQWCLSVFYTKRTWIGFLWTWWTSLGDQVCQITSSYWEFLKAYKIISIESLLR